MIPKASVCDPYEVGTRWVAKKQQKENQRRDAKNRKLHP